MNLNEILPRQQQHCCLVGKTGSGKTHLARLLLRQSKYIVVHDGKRTIARNLSQWNGYHVVGNLKSLVKLDPKRYPKLIYSPDKRNVGELLEKDYIEGFFKFIFDRENTTLYLDEVTSVCRGFFKPYYLEALLKMGRELNIRVIASTQRPAKIPIELLTEPDLFYLFQLRHADDRQRIEQITAIDADKIAHLKKRQFFYYSDDRVIDTPLRVVAEGGNESMGSTGNPATGVMAVRDASSEKAAASWYNNV